MVAGKQVLFEHIWNFDMQVFLVFKVIRNDLAAKINWCFPQPLKTFSLWNLFLFRAAFFLFQFSSFASFIDSSSKNDQLSRKITFNFWPNYCRKILQIMRHIDI